LKSQEQAEAQGAGSATVPQRGAESSRPDKPSGEVAWFRDQSGKVAVTNRPEKYQGRPSEYADITKREVRGPFFAYPYEADFLVIAKPHLNVRSIGSQDGIIVGTIPGGERIHAVEFGSMPWDMAWYEVVQSVDERVLGYVHKDYLKFDGRAGFIMAAVSVLPEDGVCLHARCAAGLPVTFLAEDGTTAKGVTGEERQITHTINDSKSWVTPVMDSGLTSRAPGYLRGYYESMTAIVGTVQPSLVERAGQGVCVLPEEYLKKHLGNESFELMDVFRLTLDGTDFGCVFRYEEPAAYMQALVLDTGGGPYVCTAEQLWLPIVFRVNQNRFMAYFCFWQGDYCGFVVCELRPFGMVRLVYANVTPSP